THFFIAHAWSDSTRHVIGRRDCCCGKCAQECSLFWLFNWASTFGVRVEGSDRGGRSREPWSPGNIRNDGASRLSSLGSRRTRRSNWLGSGIRGEIRRLYVPEKIQGNFDAGWPFDKND